MKPLLILLVLPDDHRHMHQKCYFRDTRRASFAAALGSALVVFLGVFLFDPAAAWNWVAALLVSPLPIAFGVVTVLFCYGRLQCAGVAPDGERDGARSRNGAPDPAQTHGRRMTHSSSSSE